MNEPSPVATPPALRLMPHSLKMRLSLLVMFILLAGLWAFALSISHYQEQIQQDLLAAQQRAAVAYVAEDIDNKIRLRLNGLTMIAEHFPVTNLGDAAQIETFLADRRAIYNLFDGGLIVVRPDGSGAFADFPAVAGRRTNSYGHLEPFKEVIATGKATVGPPRMGRALNKPVVVFAAPITGGDGRLMAILAGITSLDAPNFLDLVAKPRPGANGDYLIAAPRTGVFVMGTDPSFTLKPFSPPGANPVYDRYVGGFQGSAVARNDAGVEELTSAHRIDSTGWFVMARLPARVAFAPIQQSRDLTLGGAALFSLLIALITLATLKRALRPLAEASAEMEAMTRGESPLHPLPVTYRDEIGTLVDSFNSLQEQIRAKEQELLLMANVFSHSHDGMMITDDRAVIIDVNPAFTYYTGYERDEVLGRNPRFLQSGRHDASFYTQMWECLSRQGTWQGEIWNRRKDGELIAEMLTISSVPGSGGDRKYVGIFTDITRLKKTQADLEQMAHYDALTRLPNRALLRDRLVLSVAQAKRHKRLLGVCFIDLDNFKPINDRFGHNAGDHLLLEVANRLQSTVRGEDTVARLGGDEFVVLLTRVKDLMELEAALQRLIGAITAPVEWERKALRVSASIGVTVFPQDGADPETLLRHADLAMYSAKQAGRNRYCLFDAGEDRLVRLQFERQARLRQALAGNELVLHYQPKVHMRSGQVVGVEALIRWQHPKEGLKPPGQFLPFAEESDLIVDIGEWTLREAMRQLQAWRREGLHLPISVNIAARHLQRPDFVDRLAVLRDEYADLPRFSLELEIVETSALEDIEMARRAVEGCARLGIDFALDDFGTGYSSLVYLRNLPVKSLKIDGSFLRDMGDDPHDLAIVEGVIGMGTAFGRTVVAEGVETEEQGLFLLQLGCEVAQGYGIARPMPGDRIVDWTRDYEPYPAWQSEDSAHWRREDFSLLAAEVEHRYWVERVLAALTAAGRGRQLPPLGERDCRFGRWYQGEGRERYGHLPEFAGLETLHTSVHAGANRALELAADGRHANVAVLAGDIERQRDDMVSALRQLRRAVIASRKARA